MDELVVVDVDGKPGRTGNGDDPFCALLDFPEVVGAVAAVGDAAAAAAADAAAAAAGAASGAWLEEVDVIAVAVVGPVVAMATTAADCLEADDPVGRDELPDAKAAAGEDAIGNGACEAHIEKVC